LFTTLQSLLLLTNSKPNVIQENLANAKVSARQQCVHKGPSEEIDGKSTQRNKEYNVEKVHLVCYNAVAASR